MTLRILFASPYCLLDTTNGAALATRELLEQLIRRGFSCEAVTASVFDTTRQILLYEVITRHNAIIVTQRKLTDKATSVEVLFNGLTHTILKTARSNRMHLTPEEESALLSIIEQKIYDFQPIG